MKKKGLLLIVILAGLLYFLISPFVSVSVKNTQLSAEEWTEDINFFKDQMVKKHDNFFFELSKNHFDTMIDDLLSDIPELEDHEVQLRLMEIIAKAGDPHTRLKNFIDGHDLCYPFQWFWLSDGYYIINTSTQYKHLTGSRLKEINNIDIQDIEQKVATLIPHNNVYGLRANIPNLLTDVRVLQYITGKQKIHFTLVDKNENQVDVHAQPVKRNQRNNFKKDTIFQPGIAGTNWYKYISDENMMYFKMNRSRLRDPVIRDLFEEIERKKPGRLVIDLRHNKGGSYFPNNRLIKNVVSHHELNKKGKLFVIVGRNTFSSGILYAVDLRKKTNALFYGEPTEGKPNHFGDIRKLKLPNSNLLISYSTKYFKVSDENSDSFYPDKMIDLTINHLPENEDPFMNEILCYDQES